MKLSKFTLKFESEKLNSVNLKFPEKNAHFILSMVKLLGPVTSRSPKEALNSLPRSILILSTFSGSRGGIWKSSVIFPVAKLGCSLFTDSIMHCGNFGLFLEHTLIALAGSGKKYSLRNYQVCWMTISV